LYKFDGKGICTDSNGNDAGDSVGHEVMQAYYVSENTKISIICGCYLFFFIIICLSYVNVFFY